MKEQCSCIMKEESEKGERRQQGEKEVGREERGKGERTKEPT